MSDEKNVGGRPLDGDKPRKVVLAVRISDEMKEALDAAKMPDESRAQAMRRIVAEHLNLEQA